MSAESFPHDVFLSHSAKDKAVVRPLAERLRADGLKVWFDEWVLKPGDSIPAKIEAGLERSRVLVLCLSAQPFGSDWAQLEAGTCGRRNLRFRDPLNRERRFIPLRLDDSRFCMVHELFRAYQRCAYQRAEFQKKVIALVMDDATVVLKDDLAVISLAKTWKERYEKLRGELEVVDPRRKSPANWEFVDLMEDMIPRLPGMLGAISDIVMKQGFDEIVADGFQEVIKRMPQKC
jgi:hypothetical protein